jgi:hypothetical protein
MAGGSHSAHQRRRSVLLARDPGFFGRGSHVFSEGRRRKDSRRPAG